MLEPEENGMIDIPDYEHVEDEIFPPFPPPASPERQDGERAEPDEDAYGKSRWKIMRALVSLRHFAAQVSGAVFQVLRCLLDASSETGHSSERQECQIYTFHTRQSFLEKAEDLKTLIRHMEHWAHRLFPKLQFEDFIDRVEYLGSKKRKFSATIDSHTHQNRWFLPTECTNFFFSTAGEVMENNEHDVTASELDPFLTNSSESEMFASESSKSLTEEQQQRIERNKQLALERRQAKLLSNSHLCLHLALFGQEGMAEAAKAVSTHCGEERPWAEGRAGLTSSI
ncbi:hypothetical protein P7K49_017104 [Saguinus oedipus]|uniref:TIMELESS-interacting protein n=1 Tax=Saguinus oedipus TaxID=9490 RepID=A0ABQ9V1I8_SAGOE|nr:hypothetical protein P7K49_017104 [Saguinus oedipus]